jgi:hypothetical protein
MVSVAVKAAVAVRDTVVHLRLQRASADRYANGNGNGNTFACSW